MQVLLPQSFWFGSKYEGHFCHTLDKGGKGYTVGSAKKGPGRKAG